MLNKYNVSDILIIKESLPETLFYNRNKKYGIIYCKSVLNEVLKKKFWYYGLKDIYIDINKQVIKEVSEFFVSNYMVKINDNKKD